MLLYLNAKKHIFSYFCVKASEESLEENTYNTYYKVYDTFYTEQ